MGGRHGRMAAAIQAGNGKGTKIGLRQDKVKETVVALAGITNTHLVTAFVNPYGCG